MTRHEPGPEPDWWEDGEDAARALLGHDIRAALSDVLGGLRLIDLDRVDSETRAQLERMRAAGEMLARLLEEGLHVFGDAETNQPANVQLPRLLRDVQVRWSARAREKGLEFVLSEEGMLPQIIWSDRIALERMLSNLLSNAVKYADAGRVQLTVRRTAEGGLAFTVEDEGPGFSPEALRQLFRFAGRPSGTAKPGEGLGLHIAKELATRAGGDLTVANRPQGGASVTLTLPPDCMRAANGVGEAARHPDLPDLSRHRVLVAEDSLTNQLVLRQMLESLGAEVTVAGDGVEAVQALERESFDLALIDIEMPRLSGIDVIRALRAMAGPQARMPVLAVTAYVLRANREAIHTAGADAIFAKPVGGVETLGLAIARVMRRSGAAEPAPEAPVLALAQFERLMEVAGVEAAPELLRRLIEDLRHVERQLHHALAAPDWAEIRAQTHVLIALAGAVGAVRLQHRAEAMNTDAHRRDAAAIAAAAPVLMTLLDDLILFVARRLTREGAE
jgi:CheY-like chemotaxis protein/anti-sigma regulatory factor (Ser/Thr protein kinase)/HPt (histidine-containing phosphotransfer) domain-containing protein